MLDQVTEIFGGMTKWVLLGVIGLVAILGVVLVTVIAVNIKYVLIGGSIAGVVVVGGIIIYKKLIKKDEKE